MKFTFKTTNPTGKWKSFDNPYHQVKLRGKLVGNIEHEAPHNIRLMIIKNDISEDGNTNCDWKWITLKSEHSSVQEAKDYLNENIDLIMKKWNLKQLD